MPNVDELLQGARDAISVKRVFGDAIESEGVTIIPAAKVGGGGGGGATARTTAEAASGSEPSRSAST
jgi:uncharacterized spore protein YtfJ